MVSNCSQAMLPLVSVSRHWSTRRPISSPAAALPETRCDAISFWARLALFKGDVGPAGVALVVGPGADEAIVVVLLEEVRRPAGHARGGGSRRESDALE